MSRDYITEYKLWWWKSFNLIAPRLFGGSNREAVGTDSSMYSFMVGQGVPKLLISHQVTHLLGRVYSSCPAYRSCSFFRIDGVIYW
jgi:hypothetical protein